MRLWLVDDRQGDTPASLEAILKKRIDQSEGRVVLVESGPFRPALPAAIRAGGIDLLLVHDTAWPDDVPLTDLLAGGIGLIAATTPERAVRFLALAEMYPVWTLPEAPDDTALHLALIGAAAARRRHAAAAEDLQRLQQRLADRIVVERAKGILTGRLGIGEEEAYKRLRVLSRRQRRPIRDIAQALLDTESLLLPEVNGYADLGASEERHAAPSLPPATRD